MLKVGDRVRCYKIEAGWAASCGLGGDAGTIVEVYGIRGTLPAQYYVRLDSGDYYHIFEPYLALEAKPSVGGNVFWSLVLAGIVLFSWYGPKWTR